MSESRKRKVEEEHEDGDFSATLRQLDEATVVKKSKVSESQTKVVEKKKTPIKEEIKHDVKEKKSPEKVQQKEKLVGLKTKLETPRKKLKMESPKIIFESPKKEEVASHSADSPSVDPLEKRKQKAENYRRFLAHRQEGAKNPGCKPVPEVSSFYSK